MVEKYGLKNLVFYRWISMLVLGLFFYSKRMIADQCISLAQLKENFDFSKLNTDTVIIDKDQPIAVLVNIQNYKKLMDEDFEVSFNPPVSPKTILDAYHQEYGRYKTSEQLRYISTY